MRIARSPIACTITCSPALSAPEVRAYRALGRRDEQPGVLWRIVERLKHRRGVRAERAVDESFEAADAHPLVAVAARGDRVAQPLPRRERHHRVHARDHPPRLVRALEDGEIVPRAAHVLHRGHASLGEVVHCGIEGAIGDLPRGGSGIDVVDQPLRVVLEQARRLARCVAHDETALDIGRGLRDVRRARARALLARLMCPSRRLTHTGLSGVTESIHWRVGSSPPQSVWSQSPSVIHAPLGMVFAYALMRAMNSAGVDASRSFTHREPAPRADDVDVRVDEARHEHLPVRIDDLRARARHLPDLGARAHGGDAIAAHGDRFGPRALRVAGPDARVHDGERDRSALCFRTGEASVNADIMRKAKTGVRSGEREREWCAMRSS